MWEATEGFEQESNTADAVYSDILWASAENAEDRARPLEALPGPA